MTPWVPALVKGPRAKGSYDTPAVLGAVIEKGSVLGTQSRQESTDGPYHLTQNPKVCKGLLVSQSPEPLTCAVRITPNYYYSISSGLHSPKKKYCAGQPELAIGDRGGIGDKERYWAREHPEGETRTWHTCLQALPGT